MRGTGLRPALLGALVLLLEPDCARALPQGFRDDLVTGGLTAPTAMAFLPDGRIIVTEQGGRARLVVEDVLLATPLATLPVDAQGERGLVGVAVHPNFASNGWVYFYHTVAATADPPAAAHNRVTRFVVVDDRVDPGSARTILVLDDLSSRTNHNGGALAFGKDAKLYVAVGDARTSANAQSLTTRHGKILRVDADGGIPDDNPTAFAGIAGTTEGAGRAIWAVGLRNPFRLAIHPHTGRIFVNDVGENRFEEINEGRAGANYGWPASEGPTSLPGYDGPVAAYGHNGGQPTGCAITGGAFYDVDPDGFPAEFNDKYYFVDYCADWIRFVDPGNPGTSTLFHSGLDAPVDLGAGPDGALYYLQAGNGQLRRIRYDGVAAQRVLVSTTRLEIAEGDGAALAVRLAQPPAGAASVAVRLAYADTTLQVSPATLAFNDSNWDVPQQVTVSVAQDGDGRDEGGRINLMLGTAPAVGVWVTTVDDDKPVGAPRAILSRPRPGDVVRGSGAEFFGDGIGGDRIVRAEFSVNNVLRFTDVNDTGHFHIGGDHNMWNTTVLPNGYYTLRFRVVDADGQSGSHEVKVRVLN